MSEQTLFNVIVPTRERADTLLHCLRTITMQDYARLRIIVSDNCSRDHTRQVVESFADPRITYVNPGRRLSMAVHWEYALSHVVDGWVMFIGDDDGLLPGALRTLDQLIRAHGVQAVNSSFGLFVWPDHLAEIPAGKLIVPLTASATTRSTQDDLALAFSGQLQYTQLPWLYNGGAASLDLINAARGGDGRFFRSQTPDLYSAVALSLKTDQYLQVGVPIAIGGTSRHSTGAAESIATDAEGRRAVNLYMQEDNIPFHPSLVLGKSVQIVLYECYLQAAHLHPARPLASLEGQLRVALAVAPAMHRASIAADCRKMAERNGLPPPVARWSPVAWMRRARPRVRRVMRRVVLAPGDFDVRNVHEAALASWHVYAFAMRGPVPRPLLSAISLVTEIASLIRARLASARARAELRR
jgi:hypothetical protein